MAKFLSDTVLDAGLNVIKTTATELYICTAQPTTRAEAISLSVASKTDLTSGSFTGPSDGVTGRKLIKTAESLTATSTGTALFAALCTGSVLHAVTTITSQVVTSGNTINTPAFNINQPDPV